MKQQVKERWVILPDTHGDLVDRPALECVLQAIEVLKPTGVMHLGDIGEWLSVNHHRNKKRVRQPDPCETAAKIRREVRQVRKYILDPLDDVCDNAGVKKRIILTGNHDEWLNSFVEMNPDYEHTSFDDAEGYRFDQLFNWKNRGWRVMPCGKLLKIGKLHFYHGHLYSTQNHARNHLTRMGVNVVYGHHHDFQAIHVTHADGPKGAYSLGCLKKIDPDSNKWLGYRATNWAHMFGVVDFYSDGLFSVHPVPIIKGKCTLIGLNEVIDGTKPRVLVPPRTGNGLKIWF